MNASINMDGINPLSTPQKRLLQNILASHVSSDNDLQILWEEIRQSSNERLGRDLNDTLCLINRSLKPAFGLEVRSVSLSLSGTNGDVEDGDSCRPQLYHAIVNCQADKVSKENANPEMTKNPHELALFRLIIERLVEMSAEDAQDQDSSNDDDGSSRKRRRMGTGLGSQAVLSEMQMINLRTELTGAHLGKLTIEQVQNMLELFVAQGWFVAAVNPNGDRSSNDTTPSSSSRRKKNKMKYFQLGPRAYLEFSDFLRKAGMERELLPQFLIHA